MNPEEPLPKTPECARRFTSGSVGELARALSKAQGDFAPVVARSKGQEGRRTYLYAELSDYIKATQGPLKENGLTVTQLPWDEEDPTATWLLTLLLHESGEWISSRLRMPCDGGAKAKGSAITYARRYGYAAILGIAPEDDDAGAISQPTAEGPTFLPTELVDRIKALATEEQVAKVLERFGVKTLSQLKVDQANSLIAYLTAASTATGVSFPVSKPKTNDVAGDLLAKDIKELWRKLDKHPSDLIGFVRSKGVEKLSQIPRASAQDLLKRLVQADLEQQAKSAF